MAKSIPENTTAEKMIPEEPMCCPICIDDMETGQEIVVLPCSDKHQFHLSCFQSYLYFKQECPFCKNPVQVESMSF